jgi:ElaB/YqjD/DUF883 family membrane-anchored ribosome-binding protein
MGEATDEMRSRNDVNDTALETSAIRRDENSNEGSPETAQIRSGIEQTRVDLSETIDALQEKLDPTRIAQQVKDQIKEKATEAYDTAKNTVKEATIGRAEKIVSSVSETVSDVTGRAGTAVKDTGSTVVEYIRDNPIPFALVGIGLGMLTLNKRNTGQWSYGSSSNARQGAGDLYRGGGSSGEDESSLTDRARNLVGGVAGTARGAAERASTAVSSATEGMREAMGTAADATRRQFHDASDQAVQSARAASGFFKNTLQDNPMAVGVAALAAGVIVGLTVPTTRVEGEYMGEARDRLIDQTKSVAQETAQKIQYVAAEAGNTVKETAHKEGLIGGESADRPTRL